ncbi:hypothetical protein [Saccharopolyspora erythraea]|uniref:hypothetical protein n=1 Tax=Saccharopolyspora erythraea TaxID=1836 RepID=UPI0012F88E69|nr:hypothetical protein [Saccharopolyspora erythraea]
MVSFLVALALCYVLIKIPFWILGSIRGGGRSSMLASLVRGVIAYKTFGLLARGGGGGGGAALKRRVTPSQPPDPFAKSIADAHGQYVLPLNVKRTRARKSANSRPDPKPRVNRSRAQRGDVEQQRDLPQGGGLVR